MSMTLIRANTANPVFCFMDKKRAEGKHFYVYTVAGSAKFLRIYYAKVKEYLNALEETAWYITTMAMLLRSTAIIICTGHILPGLQPEYVAGPFAMPDFLLIW